MLSGEFSRRNLRLTAFIDESYVDRWADDPDSDDILPSGASETRKQRSKVGRRLLVGAAVTSRGDELSRSITDAAALAVADDALWEPREGYKSPDQRRDRFDREGFHFTYDNADLRKRGLEAMTSVDLRFHVLHHDFALGQEKDLDAHLAMLFTLIQSILQRYAGAEVELVIENESSAHAALFGGAVAQAVSALDRTGTPRARVLARLGRKPLGGLAAADYALAIVNLDLDGGRDTRREDERQLLQRSARHLAHVMDFDNALHRRKFDSVSVPNWVRLIVDASSHPGVNQANPTLIGVGPVGPFARLRTIPQLASKLGYTYEAFVQTVARAQQADAYETKPIHLKGKRRELSIVVDEAVNDLHRRILSNLRYLSVFLHPSCVGYMSGLSAKDAAAPHVGQPWAQRLDIKDFFPSVTAAHVGVALQNFGAEKLIADELANVLTIKGSLPTGTSTSPLMSNLVLANFDREVSYWALAHGLAYSRYADDMIFSGKSWFDASTFVSSELSKLGLVLNVNKTRTRKLGQAFRVAGLTIDGDAPRVRKALKRQLRLELFNLNAALSKVGSSTQDAVSSVRELDDSDKDLFLHVRGLARYVKGVEREWSSRLLGQYPLATAALFPTDGLSRRRDPVKSLADRIRAAPFPLTDEAQPVGSEPPMTET